MIQKKCVTYNIIIIFVIKLFYLINMYTKVQLLYKCVTYYHWVNKTVKSSAHVYKIVTNYFAFTSSVTLLHYNLNTYTL